jgi:CheY-like chemotaxis protein
MGSGQRELVELHNGSLTAYSEGPGTGATFKVVLPVEDIPEPPAAERNEQIAETAASGLRVLVVDDSRDSAMALSMLIRMRGCEVRTALRGQEGLRIAEEFLPEVVFLDIGMPGMSGLEVAEQIRCAGFGKSMTLIALSGWGQAEDQEKSKKAGFDEHLVKPANTYDLGRILTKAKARRPR